MYRIVLRDPDADVDWLSGGGGTYPVPRFRPRCVCCSAETPLTRPYQPADHDQAAEPFDIPVCGACRHHVLRSHLLDQIVFLPVGLGVAVLLVGLMVWVGVDASGWYAAVVGAACASVGGGALLIRHLARRAYARHQAGRGHHTCFECHVAPGVTRIRTTNRQVVTDLLEVNGPRATLDPRSA